MGSMDLMDATGHTEIKWTDNSIYINLRPAEGKANKAERESISKMVQQGMDKGLAVFVDGRPCKKDFGEIGRRVKAIRLELSPVNVKDLLEGLFQSEVFSNQLVFQIENGVGKLEQKSISEFKVDPSDTREYKGSKPLRGG